MTLTMTEEEAETRTVDEASTTLPLLVTLVEDTTYVVEGATDTNSVEVPC